MLQSKIHGALREPPDFNCCTVNFEKLNKNIDVQASQTADRRMARSTELFLTQACVRVCIRGVIMCSQLKSLLTSRAPWPEPGTSSSRHSNTEREISKTFSIR